MINGFIEQIEAGQPVSVAEVRDAFYALTDKQVFNCLIDLADGSKRIFKLNISVIRDLDDEQIAFVNSYINAEVKSTLSVVGSKDVTVCFKTSPKSLTNFAKQLGELFCMRKGGAKSKPAKLISTSESSVDIKHASQTEYIKDKTICGLCISSSGIKGAMVAGGNLCCLKEYIWPEGKITSAKQYCDSVYMLIRLMRVQVSLNIDSAILLPEDRILFQQDLTNAMQKDATYDEMAAIVKIMEKELKGKLIGIDAVGLSFPDAELKDKALSTAVKPKDVTLYQVDEDIADSELISQLEDHPQVSVMQFSNTIAAVYHANLALLAK